jgi:hypothetical protein
MKMTSLLAAIALTTVFNIDLKASNQNLTLIKDISCLIISSSDNTDTSETEMKRKPSYSSTGEDVATGSFTGKHLGNTFYVSLDEEALYLYAGNSLSKLKMPRGSFLELQSLENNIEDNSGLTVSIPLTINENDTYDIKYRLVCGLN